MGRPLTILERIGFFGQQSLARDHHAYCDSATDRQHATRRHSSSRGTSQLNPLRHTARGHPIRCWWLRMGVQHGCHHLPRRDDEHGRQGPQGQFLVTLNGPLQGPRSWPLHARRQPGRLPPWATSSYFGCNLRHSGRGCSPARFGATLQALCQPPRPRRRVVSASRFDAIRAQQCLQETLAAPRYSRRRFDSSSSTQVEKMTGHQSVRGRGEIIVVM